MSQLALDWERQHAAIWRNYSHDLRAVVDIDPISLEQLSGVDAQAQSLCDNTECLLADAKAEHALLWGARGCGKSSLVKAVFNRYRQRGLRLLEIDPGDLSALPLLTDYLRGLQQRFIIFVDDLGFDQPSATSRSLKVLLEGSVELVPSNVVLYATANRRHLLPEDDSSATKLHPGDEVQERISLTDRFGLNLSFYSWERESFLRWISEQLQVPVEQIAREADLFASARGARSGRVASQFVAYYRRTQQSFAKL